MAAAQRPLATPDPSTTDPVHVLWRALGRPQPDVRWRPGSRTCARCGTPTDPHARLNDVISDRFTGWEAYATGDNTPVWCPPCAWGHSTADLRQRPWQVSQDPTCCRALDPVGLAAALRRPLSPSEAVVLPLSRKKHLLPTARFGLLTIEDLTVSWTANEVTLLGHLHRLRRLGFTEASLADPAPRFDTLVALPADDQSLAFTAWPLLDPWRSTPALLAAGLRACRGMR